MEFQYKPAGDLAILVKVGDAIDEKTNVKVIGLANYIEAEIHLGFTEVIPGYNTLLVSYDPIKLTYEQALFHLHKWENEIDEQKTNLTRIVEIPTIYGGEWGPDLHYVAEHNGLTMEEVVFIHSATKYLVYFIGFTPGFPFLGGMSTKIATPRLASPRVSIPAGSVGIANHQTGIYPVSSPGGWRLIGRTPLKLFSPENKLHPFLLHPGDYVRFTPIDEEHYKKIKFEIEEGIYEPVILRSEQHESI